MQHPSDLALFMWLDSSPTIPLRCSNHTNSSEVPAIGSGLHVFTRATPSACHVLHLDNLDAFSLTHLKCQLLGQAFSKKLIQPKVHFCGSKTSHIGNCMLFVICYHKYQPEPHIRESGYHLLKSNSVIHICSTNIKVLYTYHLISISKS